MWHLFTFHKCAGHKFCCRFDLFDDAVDVCGCTSIHRNTFDSLSDVFLRAVRCLVLLVFIALIRCCFYYYQLGKHNLVLGLLLYFLIVLFKKTLK